MDIIISTMPEAGILAQAIRQHVITIFEESFGFEGLNKEVNKATHLILDMFILLAAEKMTCSEQELTSRIMAEIYTHFDRVGHRVGMWAIELVAHEVLHMSEFKSLHQRLNKVFDNIAPQDFVQGYDIAVTHRHLVISV